MVKNAHVLRVAIEKGRAWGIECVLDGLSVETLHADRQVILSAGSIGSPHLLMLSGVGPAEHLQEHDIKVCLDNADVGQNLEDHLGGTTVGARVKDLDAIYGRLPKTFEESLDEFEQTGGGMLATLQLDAGAFFAVDPGFEYPQCQTFFSPGISEFYRTDGAPDRSRYTAGGYICKSRSRGSVSLASANPLDAPLIDPNYLSEPDDLRVQIEHVKWNIEVLNAKPFGKVWTEPRSRISKTTARLKRSFGRTLLRSGIPLELAEWAQKDRLSSVRSCQCTALTACRFATHRSCQP